MFQSSMLPSSTLRVALSRANNCLSGQQAFNSGKICTRNFSNFRKSPFVLEALRLRSVKSWTRSEFLKGSRFFRSGSGSMYQESSISWRRFGTTAVGGSSSMFCCF